MEEITELNSSKERREISKRKFRIFLFPVLRKIISLIFSIVILCSLVLISGGVTDYFYYMKHPSSIGEDDLGVGLVMVLWAIIAFPSAIFLYFPLYRFILEKITKFIGER